MRPRDTTCGKALSRDGAGAVASLAALIGFWAGFVRRGFQRPGGDLAGALPVPDSRERLALKLIAVSFFARPLG